MVQNKATSSPPTPAASSPFVQPQPQPNPMHPNIIPGAIPPQPGAPQVSAMRIVFTPQDFARAMQVRKNF
jgi:hypothetical protein